MSGAKIDPISIRADFLVTIREQLEVLHWFRQLAGPLSQFQLVLDANVLIGSMIWMTLTREKPDARDGLLECLDTKMISAYVTPRVIGEVERDILDRAVQTGTDLAEWRSNWAKIKAHLRVQEPPAALVEKYVTGRHPADAPTLALAEHLSNATIVSDDPDIPAMWPAAGLVDARLS